MAADAGSIIDRAGIHARSELRGVPAGRRTRHRAGAACEALDRAREVDVADASRLRLVETLSADCLRCLSGRVAVSWQSGDPMDTVSTIV